MSVEYSESNRELRTVYSVFRDRACIAHDWTAQPNSVVEEGDVLGTFDFDDGGSEPILAPTSGRIIRLFRPPIGALGGRPSQVLALFEELAAAALVAGGTRGLRGRGDGARAVPAVRPQARAARAPKRRSGRKPGRKRRLGKRGKRGGQRGRGRG
jgi:hypothetical protein